MHTQILLAVIIKVFFRSYNNNTTATCGRTLKMQLITVHVPIAYLEGIDQLITEGAYPNRSETIRVAIRDLLKTELGFLRRYKSQAQNEAEVEL